MSRRSDGLHQLLQGLQGKTITSVIPTFITDMDRLGELQFQFSDGTHLIVEGWSNGWDYDDFGVMVTTDLAKGWWL